MKTAIKETPILMQTDMGKAIYDDLKTQTRRVINIPKQGRIKRGHYVMPNETNPKGGVSICFDTSGLADFKVLPCPYGQVGDRLWVRETHYRYGYWVRNGITKTGRQQWRFHEIKLYDNFRYYENPPDEVKPNSHRNAGWYKRSAIFMPKKYARLWLEITDIRVERLQDITEDDAKAEGVFVLYDQYQRETKNYPVFDYGVYAWYWDKLNIKRGYGWDINPWVWVILFKLLRNVTLDATPTHLSIAAGS